MVEDTSSDIGAGRTFASGLAMGGADAVPGVSASTMALILGLYRRFIESLNAIIQWPKSLRSDEDARIKAKEDGFRALTFLIPLGLGMFAGLYIISWLLIGPDDAPGWLRRDSTGALAYAFVFGLVLASIKIPWQRIEVTGNDHILLALVSALALAMLTMLGFNESEPPAWTLPLAGICAISAMLVPGISGSLILLILGHYAIVTSALHDAEYATLAIFATGILIGAALVVPIISRLLHEHHDRLMAVLTGLIAGSLPTLWPWKNQYDIEQGEMSNILPEGQFILVLLWMSVGISLILFTHELERRAGKKSDDATEEA